MPRRLHAIARATVLSLLIAACSSASGAGVEQRLGASMRALGPRVVLLYADVSASVPDTAWHASLRRLSRELRPGDRVALFALGGAGARRPDPRHDRGWRGGGSPLEWAGAVHEGESP